MENKTKNSKGCPVCAKMLFKGLVFEGDSMDMTTKCPSCGEPLFIQISKKTLITVTRLSIVILIVALFSITSVLAKKQHINCASFLTQPAAQKVYESNKIKYKELDRDHDGKACE